MNGSRKRARQSFCYLPALEIDQTLVRIGVVWEHIMEMRHAALLAATAGISPLALGQVQRPAFYVWSSGGHSYSGTSTRAYADTPNLRAMAHP